MYKYIFHFIHSSLEDKTCIIETTANDDNDDNDINGLPGLPDDEQKRKYRSSFKNVSIRARHPLF